MSQRERSTAAASWAEELAERIAAQRNRLRDAVAEQREKAGHWETTLQTQLSAIEQGLQAAAEEGQQRDADISQRLTLLKTEQEHLSARDADLVSHRDELASLRQSLESAQRTQLAQEQALLDEVTRSLAKLQEREAVLARQLTEVVTAQADVAAQQRAGDELQQAVRERNKALEQREADLQAAEEDRHQRSEAIRTAEDAVALRELQVEQRENELKLAEQRTRNQRSSTAQELRVRRKELLIDRQRQQLDSLESARLLADDETALAQQLIQARQDLARLHENEASQAQRQREVETSWEQAKTELLQLNKRLKEAEGRPTAAANPDADDMRKRLEMALADVRELKTRNSELADQLAKGKSSNPVVSTSSGGGEDWESRKQRMIAQLESDFDVADPQQKANKLTVQETIERTDELVAAKSQEIMELQRLLSEQSGNIGGVAIGAAAIAQMFDSDELVRQERDSLRDLQEKLREQLKHAEIDISMERAKIAASAPSWTRRCGNTSSASSNLHPRAMTPRAKESRGATAVAGCNGSGCATMRKSKNSVRRLARGPAQTFGPCNLQQKKAARAVKLAPPILSLPRILTRQRGAMAGGISESRRRSVDGGRSGRFAPPKRLGKSMMTQI